MHNTKPYVHKVRVINIYNQIQAEYETVADAKRYLWTDLRIDRWQGNTIGISFEPSTREYYPGYFSEPRRVDFIAVNEVGDVYGPSEFRPYRKPRRWHHRDGRVGKTWNFRSPRTQQEREQWFAAIDQDCDVPIKMRMRRHPTVLPTLWDDLHGRNGPSWKDWRKTQYRDKVTKRAERRHHKEKV